jgi:hypothetical protein
LLLSVVWQPVPKTQVDKTIAAVASDRIRFDIGLNSFFAGGPARTDSRLGRSRRTL